MHCHTWNGTREERQRKQLETRKTEAKWKKKGGRKGRHLTGFVKWNSTSSVKGNSERYHISPLLSTLPSLSSPAIAELTHVCVRRQSAVHRVTIKSSAFHTFCHRCSSAVGKTSSGAGCEDVTEPLMDGRQLEGASLLLTHVCWVCYNPSEVYHIAVLFFGGGEITLQHMGMRDWARIDNLQIEELRICVVLRVKMKAWWDVKWNSLLYTADGTIHLPEFEVTQSHLMRKLDLHVQINSKEFHSHTRWRRSFNIISWSLFSHVPVSVCLCCWVFFT